MTNSAKSSYGKQMIDLKDDEQCNREMIETRERILSLINSMSKESERSAAILAAANIDVALERLLKIKLLPCDSRVDPLFDADRILGTFSAKIAMSYRLGIIDKETEHALQLVRRIRNDFAHAPDDESFASERQRPRIAELEAIFKSIKSYQLCLKLYPEKLAEHPQGKFIAIVATLTLCLRAAVFTTRQVGDKMAASIRDD